jgi:hypothetical protein
MAGRQREISVSEFFLVESEQWVAAVAKDAAASFSFLLKT